MTYSSLSDAVTGFKSDADRVDTFGNGDANATYTSKTGAIVPSIQNLIGQWNYSINVAANGILAQSTAQAGAAAQSAATAQAIATQFGDVAGAVGAATAQAGVATTQAGVATTQAGIASGAATQAAAYRDAAQLSKGIFPTTASALGNGVLGYASLVGGSGGANGTFALAFSGGTQVVAPAGYFVVSGGAVTQIVITYPGYYSAGTPTLSFAASAGLTGASASAVMGANVPVGQYFNTPGASSNLLNLYQVTAGPAATLVASYPTGDFTQKIGSPFAKSLTVTNAAGDATMYGNLLRGVIDVKLYGSVLPATDSYYIERVRRNYSGNWHIVVKRASDNATVLQFFGVLTEPADPTAEQRILLPSVLAGAIGYIIVRWSEFVVGANVTGLTMTLSPDCVNRTLATQESAMPRTAARIGQVPLTLDPAAFVTVNEATRTVSWPELRFVDGRANSYGYYKLAAGSVTFNAALQVAYLDLVQAATYAGGTAIPASAVVLGAYGIEDPNGTGYYGSAHQFPIAWSSGAGRVDTNPMLRIAPPAATTVYRDDMVVKVDLTNNLVSIYVRANGNDANSLTYIQYKLYHYVASNADVWTIDGIYEVSRTGYQSFSAGLELVVPATELLCALQELGAADFMGGRAHGDEVVTQVPTLLLDGRTVSVSSGALSWYHAKEITFIQSSILYRDGSLATPLTVPLANRKLWLSFRDGEMIADQRIEHLASYTLQTGYLAMLAPHRYSSYNGSVSEDNTSSQISGYYADNVRMIPMDATAKQAGQVASDYVYNTTPPVTKVKLWGSYGVECSVEMLSASDNILQNLMYVNRTSYAYNKAYIGFIGGYSGNQSVTASTKWQAKTRWRFDSKN